MDNRIDNLKAGESIEISWYGDKWVTCERSGDGQVIRFVRHTKNTSKVFRVRNFGDKS